MRPPRTVLDELNDAGVPVISIGKVEDLFAGQGITESHPTATNEEGMQSIDAIWNSVEHGLVFANLVDFDTEFGHRRDPDGYANALQAFDSWLERFLPRCLPEDLVIITADHGNDPTFRGTDHTREQVPLMIVHQNRTANLGRLGSFTFVADQLRSYFGLSAAEKSIAQRITSPLRSASQPQATSRSTTTH